MMPAPQSAHHLLAALDEERAFDHAHAQEHDHAVPRVPLFAAISLALVALALVALVRLAGFDPVDAPSAEQVARDLRFEDRPGGAVAVFDHPSQNLVAIVPGGSDSFVRSTMRSLARDRRREGVGAEAPFHLAWHADGRLTLSDPITGRRLDLIAFGQDNARAFARWLPAPTNSMKD